MKKVILFFCAFFSSLSFAQNPFDQFIGVYSVVEENCKSKSDLFETLRSLEIEKGSGLSGRNIEDTFINFYRGSSTSAITASSNLSAFSKVISTTEEGEVVFKVDEGNSFSMKHINENKYSFKFLHESNNFYDDCVYILESR